MAKHIPDEIHEHINRCLATGQYESEAAVPRAAFAAREMHQADVAAIRERLTDVDQDRFRDFDEVNAEIRSKHGWWVHK